MLQLKILRDAVIFLCLISIHTLPVLATMIQVPTDFPTIQKAIDASVDGDVIEIDADGGPYIEQISIRKSITLKSVNGRTILQTDSEERHNTTVSIQGIENASLQGFLVITPIHFQATGIDISGSENVSIVDNVVKGSSLAIADFTNGISVDRCQGCELKDNVFRNHYVGIRLHQSTQNLILENLVEDNFFGISLTRSSENTIIANTSNLNGSGILSNENSHNNLIRENTITNMREPRVGRGINIRSSSGNVVFQNTVEGSIGVGPGSHNTRVEANILLEQEVEILVLRSDNNVVTANRLSFGPGNISLVRSSNNIISENIISRSDGRSGIELLQGSENNTILNNQLKQIGNMGIVLDNSSHNVIQDNMLGTTTHIGIQAIGPVTNNTIIGNSIIFKRSGNEQVGIYLENATEHSIQNNSIRIEPNSVQGSQGLTLVSSRQTRLYGNTVENFNTGLGLSFSDNNEIEGNNFSNGQVDGIRLSDSSNNRLGENLIQGYDVSGISLLTTSDDNVISHNEVTESGFGIRLFQSSGNTIQSNRVEHNPGVGINLWIDSGRNLVIDNSVMHNGEGITLKLNRDNRLETNLISNNDVGVSAGDVSSTDILNNTFIDNILIHLFLFIQSSFTVTGNTFAGGTSGIVLDTVSEGQLRSNLLSEMLYAVSIESASSIQIENNALFQNDVAIRFESDAAIRPATHFLNLIDIRQNVFEQNRLGMWFPERATLGENIVLQENNFLENSEFGILNEALQPLNAVQNWWGHESGPGGTGPGQGDTVSDNVIFDPWHTEVVPLSGPTLPPPQPLSGDQRRTSQATTPATLGKEGYEL